MTTPSEDDPSPSLSAPSVRVDDGSVGAWGDATSPPNAPRGTESAVSLRTILEVWRLAWPTVLTMTSYTVMQFIDKLMVAQIGPLEVAAQGNGGIWSFSLIAFLMGVLTVVNTFVAQHLGAGRAAEGQRYAWAGLWLSLVAWVVLLLPFAAIIGPLFSALGHAEELVRLETTYARILLVGSVLLLANKAMSHYFFGMHRPKVITAAAILGNVVNVGLNYVLIFGSDGIPALGLPGVPGMPPLGIAGAAIATVIGTGVELAIPMAIFLGRTSNRLYRTRAAWRPQWKPIRELLTLGWPAAVQFGNEIVCWAIFMSVLAGRFGPDHMTAGWVTLGFMHLSFMPAVGFSVAVSSLVGRYCGARDQVTAAARARLGVGMAMVYMTLCAVAFVVFRHELIGSFIAADVDPESAARILAIGGQLMICAAVFQTADALGVVYSGALRGAGDTVWPGVVTILYSWIFIVGGGAAFVIWLPQLESLGPWIAAAAYIIIYGITMWLRFEGGRWRSIRLVGDRGARQGTESVAELEVGRNGAGLIAGAGPPAGMAQGSVEDIAESRLRSDSADPLV